MLAAMEQLWAKGAEVNLVIVGKCGWKMKEFETIVSQHTEPN